MSWSGRGRFAIKQSEPIPGTPMPRLAAEATVPDFGPPLDRLSTLVKGISRQVGR
jgi:hypothetical protein